MRRTIVLLALPVAIATAQSRAAGQTAAKHIEPAISKAGSDYVAAVSARDAAKVASLYTDDAIEMPPNAKAVSGRSAIEAFYKQQFAEMDVKPSLKPTESMITGSTAYEVGTYQDTIKLKSGQTITDVGKYIVLLKAGADKQWRIYRVIYNSDNPPPPPPPVK